MNGDQNRFGGDPLLATIVEISTKIDDKTQGKLSLGITLSTGGILVTGNIVDARQFMLDNPLTDSILEALDQSDKSGEPSQRGHEQKLPEYIHLSNARFFVPGQLPVPTTGKGVCWRGRISEVAGFSFGILQVGPPPED